MYAILCAAASVGLLLTPTALSPGLRVGRMSALAMMALDYKDPDVAAEFTKCQSMDTEAVEEELAASGIPVPPTMNDMDMRMMLVEMRMRKAGKMGASKPEMKKPGPNANDFEKALYDKPVFRELFEEWQQMRNTNAMNLAAEYINNPRRAKERYGGTAKYEETVAMIEHALSAKKEKVATSGRLTYSGFPANMGEAGVKMTLGAFGELKEFTFNENDDGMTCSGTAEFEDVDTAKAAIEKYDGMDMGLGNAITLEPL